MTLHSLSSSMTVVPKPLNPSGTSLTVTKEKSSSFASSSSFLFRAMRMRILLGTPRIPLLHTNLLSFTSTLTSVVPIAFWANFLISLMAFGAFFLNVLHSKIQVINPRLKGKDLPLQVINSHTWKCLYPTLQ